MADFMCPTMINQLYDKLPLRTIHIIVVFQKLNPYGTRVPCVILSELVNINILNKIQMTRETKRMFCNFQ